MLEAAGITVKYLPKSQVLDNFFTAQMDKFRILDMVEYRRVLYMDSDVLPFCSLDYFFELSDGPDAILRENIVLVGISEPAQGGLFMLKPNHEDFVELTEMMNKYLEGGGEFDKEIGWGHKITFPDDWRFPDQYGFMKAGTKWDFYAANADQGLLYYWTKYRKKNVSILGEEIAESWYGEKVIGEDGTEESTEIHNDLHMMITDVHLSRRCSPFESGDFGLKLYAPYSDFRHYTGRYKPWKKITNLKDLPSTADGIMDGFV